MAMTENEVRELFEKLKNGPLTPQGASSVLLVIAIFRELRDELHGIDASALATLTHAAVAAMVPDA